MDNLVRRMSSAERHEATHAIDLMIADVSAMWDGFNCDRQIVNDRNGGAYVLVNIPLDDAPEAFTRAYLLRKGAEFVCCIDFYMGEGYAVKGSHGNEYTVNEYAELEAA